MQENHRVGSGALLSSARAGVHEPLGKEQGVASNEWDVLLKPNAATRPIDWAAPLATIFLWSGNTIGTKASFGVIAPESIAFYRSILAFLVLLPLIGPAAWRNRSVALRYWKQWIVLGALGMAIPYNLSYLASATTTAVNMGIISALAPLIATVLANLLAGERLPAMRTVGGVVSLGGVAYFISAGNPTDLFRGGFQIGDGLLLVAVTANALYGVMLLRWTLPVPVWQQLFWQITVVTLMQIPLWLIGSSSPITAESAPLIVYAALASTLGATLCWMLGVRKLGAGRASFLMYLMPVTIALLAWSILGEHLYAYHVIGGAVTLLGISLGLRERSPAVTARRR